MELRTKFRQLHDPDKKFSFLKSGNLLKEISLPDLTHGPNDVNKLDFLVEHKRLREFIKTCGEEEKNKLINSGPLEVPQFIKTYGLDICEHRRRLTSLPNSRDKQRKLRILAAFLESETHKELFAHR